MPQLDPARPATAVDVARHAGLSRSTVSQILGGYGDRFLEETREKVAAAAAELNYRPSRAGRALVTGVADIVVVVVPNITFGSHLQDTLDRVSQATEQYGLSVLLRYAGDDTGSTLQTILDLRPAVILDLGVFDAAQRATIRTAGTRVIPEVDQAHLGEDPNHLIGRMQVEHLLRAGTRRLVSALLDDVRQDIFGPLRAQGIAAAAAEAGAAPPVEVRVPLDRDAATAVLRPHLEGDDPVGVCCYNDDVAMAVVAACHDLGISIPDQVSVIGVDRTAGGQLISPRLTSISVDMPGLVERLFGELADADSASGGSSIVYTDLEGYVNLIPGESS